MLDGTWTESQFADRFLWLHQRQQGTPQFTVDGLSHKAQTAQLDKGEGTIYAFHDLPAINKLRQMLFEMFGERARAIVAEVNHYYNTKTTYIGYHGDAERKIVICFRFGAEFPMMFQWYLRFSPIGETLCLMLRDGDMYAMSANAVGSNWKSSSFPTVRNAAGFCVPSKKKTMEAKKRKNERKRNKDDEGEQKGEQNRANKKSRTQRDSNSRG